MNRVGTNYTQDRYCRDQDGIGQSGNLREDPASQQANAKHCKLGQYETRKEGVSHPREIIPIRVLEIGEVNTAFEWASTTIKKQLTKDFTASESDIDSIQQVMDSGRFQTQQRMAWENFGIAFGAILVNEMEGMEWVTVIEGQKEYPALQFMCSDMVLDPAALVWGQAKKGLPCDLKSEFRKIKREAEAVLDDLNK